MYSSKLICVVTFWHTIQLKWTWYTNILMLTPLELFIISKLPNPMKSKTYLSTWNTTPLFNICVCVLHTLPYCPWNVDLFVLCTCSPIAPACTCVYIHHCTVCIIDICCCASLPYLILGQCYTPILCILLYLIVSYCIL